MGTSRVELAGDTAEVVTPCLNPMPVGAGGAIALLGHWYRDTMTRTDQGWRITERYFEVTWRVDPPQGGDVLAALADKQEITEALHRYCHALDRYDREMALAVWHTDGTADYGADLYQGPAEGLVDWLWETHSTTSARSHQVANILVELDGDEARSESYVTVALRFAPEGGDVVDSIARARYSDTWSRREGRWAIDHRKLTIDMSTTAP
jgi:hypothetical protein